MFDTKLIEYFVLMLHLNWHTLMKCKYNPLKYFVRNSHFIFIYKVLSSQKSSNPSL